MAPPDFIAGALVAGGAANAVLLYSFGSAWFRRGAPFVPTAASKVKAIFGPGGLLDKVPGGRRHMVDLGSGGGELVRAAARQGKYARATGYEINGALFLYSRLRSCLSTNEHFRMQSLWEADVSDADLVFVYGVPSILTPLQRKLSLELPPGAHVVSNAFPFPPDHTWAEVSRQWVEAGMTHGTLDDSSQVFVYRVGSPGRVDRGIDRRDLKE